jgi:hypothetical protein
MGTDADILFATWNVAVYVSPVSGPTSEAGGTATFTVTLGSQPSANVTIPLTSSDPTEGTVPASVTITPAQWNTGVVVTVTGVDDALFDGPIDYTIITGDPTSADADYNALGAAIVPDVAVMNDDNETTNHAPALTPAGPSAQTDPQTAVTLALASVINNGQGTTTVTDADAEDVVGGIAVVGASGLGTLAYSLNGTTFYDLAAPPSQTAALLLPANAWIRYTPDGVNAEIAALTFLAWDATSGVAGSTADTTTNGSFSPFSAATDTLTLNVVRERDCDSNLGLYNPSDGRFYLENGQHGGNADMAFRYSPDELGWQSIVGDWNNDGTETVGLYDPATGAFYLRNSNDAGAANVTFIYGPGGLGWQPLSGDWNHDGVDTVGLYNPATGAFYLRNSNSSGAANVTFVYGPGGLGWEPIVGDWNKDGTDTVGLYDPGSGVFYLRNSNSAGAANATFVYGPGGLGWLPLAGDWNKDGADTVGLHDPATAGFYLRNSNDSGVANVTFAYGPASAGWQPLMGDWNKDGAESVGLRDPNTDTFYLRNVNAAGVSDIAFRYGPGRQDWESLSGDWNGDGLESVGVRAPRTGTFSLRDFNEAGDADRTFAYGPAGSAWKPVVGDWDGNTTDTIGLYDPAAGTFYLRNSNSGGLADVTFGYGPGGLGWQPLVGDWNGDGTETVGLYVPTTGTFYLRNSNSAGVSDIAFNYGPGGLGWQPIVGDWNHDGVDTVGLYNPAAGTFYLRNSNGAGVADVTCAYGPGGAGWRPLAGNWNGNAFAFLGEYPEPQIVSYTRKSGGSAQTLAYPGQIELYVSPGTSFAAVRTLVEANGGTVIGQMPSVGYYLAGIAPGSEQTFTAAVYANAGVLLAVPNIVLGSAAVDLSDRLGPGGELPLAPLIGTQVGTGVSLGIIDNFSYPSLPTNTAGTISHGAGVQYVATQGTGAGALINVGIPGSPFLAGDRMQIMHAIQAAPGTDRVVINISAESGASTYATYTGPGGQALFLERYVQQLASLQPDVLARTVLVVAAGNGIPDVGEPNGMDLAATLRDLHARYPSVFPADGGHHMLVVGGTMAGSTVIDTGFNYVNPLGDENDAAQNPLMVYAQGNQVQIHSDGSTANGTSFAAPAISRLLAQALAARPGATAGEIVDAFLQAYQQVGTHGLPTLEEILTQFDPPTLSINDTSVVEGNGGGTTEASLLVTLSHKLDEAVTFYYEGRDGTALAVRDYETIPKTLVTIAAGQTTATVPLAIVADGTDEPNRTFYVDLKDVSSNVNTGASDLVGDVTIEDDDTPVPPTISINNVQVVEGNAGTKAATFTVTLSEPHIVDVTFEYYTSPVSATANVDYTTVYTSGVIPKFTTQTTVTVAVRGDTVVEPDETFRVYLTNVPNAYIFSPGYGTGTIVNDDQPPVAGPYQLLVAEVVGSGYYSSRVWDDTGQIDTDQGKYMGTYTPPDQGSHWLQTSDAFSDIYNADTGQLIATGTLFFDSSSIPSGLTVRVEYASYLQAAAPEEALVPAGPAVALTQDLLDPIVAQAIADWADLGLATDQLETLVGVRFVIADLPGAQLGLAERDTIFLDLNAAGHGWFIDPTPGTSAEFTPGSPDSAVIDRIDLLTVVSHEIGHTLGLDDLDASLDSLMSGALETGVRREPGAAEIDALFARV